MMLAELRQLLAAGPAAEQKLDYEHAVLIENVLGKASASSRQRSFRYLCELYGLDRRIATFRALHRLWALDVEAQPLIALSSALTRDPALRSTAEALLRTPAGATVTADDLAAAVADAHPDHYGESVAHKIGRNAASSWTQSGHIAGRNPRRRVRAQPRPASVAYALFVASLEGRQGELLFEAIPVRAQDAPLHILKELAREASRRGWLDFRSIGSVTEIGFTFLEVQEPAT
jgi:hypothetical protein